MKLIILLIFLSVTACGGGGGGGSGQTENTGNEQNQGTDTDSGSNDAQDSQQTDNDSDDQVNGGDTDTESQNEIEPSVGEVLIATGYPFTGTNGAPLDALLEVAINSDNISFAARYSVANEDRAALWIGEIDNPQPVLASGTALPLIPSENNQYIGTNSLEYFDDGVLGVFFSRNDDETGYMTIEGTDAFIVATTGATLQGIIEPRTITGIERVAHSGTRNLFVGRTELGFAAVLWQVDGTDVTPIASTYTTDFDIRPKVDNCRISLLPRDNQISRDPSLNALASRDIPNIGITDSGEALFMAELSGTACTNPGVDIVRHNNGVYSRMMLTGALLSLRDVFPDGSFIFRKENSLMFYSTTGDISDVTDPSILGRSEFGNSLSLIEALTVDAWLERPTSLPIDTVFSAVEIKEVGADGSVVFDSIFRGQSDDKLSSRALWILLPTGEVVRILSEGDPARVQGDERQIRGVSGYTIEDYNIPDGYIVVRTVLGDTLGNPGGNVAILRINL